MNRWEVLKSCRQVLGIVFILSSSLLAETTFPLPEGLRPNVDFWKKVYSEYGTHEVVLHDKTHLQVIYQVISFNSDSSGVLSRAQWNQIEEIKKEIITILERLAEKKSIVPALLTPEENRMVQLWAPAVDPETFLLASQNIRAQQGLRQQFIEGLVRSGRYLEQIKQILRDHKVPDALCYLPHVESSFNYRAYSKLGAAGMWQFTRSTGRLYMKVEYAIDERLDPIWSTIAAAKLLRKNYEELNSWPLAITAYNHGLAGMKRAKQQCGTDDLGVIASSYNSRTFGFASRNFYAEFLAAREIADNFDKYFGMLELEKPAANTIFVLPDYIVFDQIAKRFNLDTRLVADLNPALRTPIIKSQRRIPRGFRLRLPAQAGVDYSALYAGIPESKKFNDQVHDRYYRVKAGDNLSNLARQFGTTMGTLMALNNIRNPNLIRVGQIVELPELAQSLTLPQDTLEPPQETLGGGLEEEPISSIHGQAKVADPQSPLSAEPILPLRMTQPAEPFADFRVDFEEPKDSKVIVQPEETLGHFAEWLNLPAQRLRDVNHLIQGQELQIGQQMHLIFTKVSPAEFHRFRLEYHKSIQEDFFSHFTIESVSEYKVNSGDNLWQLCNSKFGIPLWLLQRTNPGVDLARLHPGDIVRVPITRPRTAHPAALNLEE